MANQNVALNLKGGMHSLAFKIASIFHQTGKPNLILSTVSQIVFITLKTSIKSLLFPIICINRNFFPLSITLYFVIKY